MAFEPPTPVSRSEYLIKVQDLEPLLRPPEMAVLREKTYPPKLVELRDGTHLLIRQAERDEADAVLRAIRPYMDVHKDFYDIVAVRTYGEVLAWKMYRIKDSYVLLGIRDNEMVGLVNARLMNEKVAISLHTMAFARGIDVGPALYFAKAEYAFDHLGTEEWWATFESYVGLRGMGIKWGKKQKPWPEFQHELGGA
ncbi:MAG: N-acetyltransferase, partial [Candidatus Geothermarchaeales archaeon]